jgi:hypothetical protein
MDFKHSYLQSCVLNAYPYATDSLIEELCLSASSVSITKLSLNGCDVITNAGIQNIQSKSCSNKDIISHLG